MVGRHAECQIRPKSRSVSRRHCLVHHAGGVVKVLDLKSTTGTIVNAKRLEPHAWSALKDGDQIRCGKVVFRLALHPSDQQRNAPTTGSMPAGEAMHEFDVASFLDAEDEADREERYREIREGRPTETFDTDSTDDAESIDSFEDTFSDEASPTRTTQKKAKKKAEPSPRARKSKKASLPTKLPKAKRAKTPRSMPSFSFRDSEKLKTMGAVLITLAILGLFGYQIYRFVSPPTMRVVEELEY